MNVDRVQNIEVSDSDHVCSVSHVKWMDNFIRPLIHNPKRLFGKYVNSGMTVLDVGCGGGFASLGLARLVGNNGKVVSADLQQGMLEIAKKRAEKAGLSNIMEFHVCESHKVGVSGDFDFALAFYMLHETPNYEAFLREIYSILKSGGVFFVADPKLHVSKDYFEETMGKAEEIGFKIAERPKVLLSRAVVLEKP